MQDKREAKLDEAESFQNQADAKQGEIDALGDERTRINGEIGPLNTEWTNLAAKLRKKKKARETALGSDGDRLDDEIERINKRIRAIAESLRKKNNRLVAIADGIKTKKAEKLSLLNQKGGALYTEIVLGRQYDKVIADQESTWISIHAKEKELQEKRRRLAELQGR